MPGKRLLIIGVGNPDRGDDAAGRAVAARLRSHLDDRAETDGIVVIEQGGEATALLDAMTGCETVVIIDAAISGAAPGGYSCFEASEMALPDKLADVSAHGFGVARAIELGRALGSLPARCLVYAIEAESFEIGAAMSPGVAGAVKTVAADILSAFVLDHH